MLMLEYFVPLFALLADTIISLTDGTNFQDKQYKDFS